jgi:hypothetical protein
MREILFRGKRIDNSEWIEGDLLSKCSGSPKISIHGEYNRGSMKETICPICEYQISYCQCLFSGSAHPDTSKRREVVLDHLYLLSNEQIKHLQNLQSFWQTSYSDESMNEIVKELKEEV